MCFLRPIFQIEMDQPCPQKGGRQQTKIALSWTPEGNSKRGRPKKPGRKLRKEEELKQIHLSWGQAANQAADRKRWRTLGSV